MSPWLMVLPVGGLGWWMLGFPPGWGWLVLPMIPSMPVSFSIRTGAPNGQRRLGVTPGRRSR